MTLLDRDRGLVRGVGALGLASTVFNTVVGAGIFVLPAALARDVGGAAPLAYLACVVAMGAVSLCFAAASGRVPTSGGPYGFVEAAFGPLMGFVVGMLVWLAAVLAAAGIASAVVEALARFIPALAGPLPRAAVILVLFALLAVVNIAGVEPGARLVGWLTIVKLAPLLLLIALAAPHLHARNFSLALPSGGGFGRGMILALFAFQGMETALGVSGEVTRPERNVPLGLLGAMAAVAVLYMGVQAAAQGVLGPALAGSHAPLADAMSAIAPALTPLVLAGAIVSMLGYLASDALGAPRLVFAFARDGLLPRQLAALHPKSRAPHRAIALHTALAAALAVTGSFTELVLLASLSALVVYIVGCAAAWRLQQKRVALAGPAQIWPGLGLIALVGAGSMAWTCAHATAAEALGGLAAIAASVVWFLVSRRLGRGRPPFADPAAG